MIACVALSYQQSSNHNQYKYARPLLSITTLYLQSHHTQEIHDSRTDNPNNCDYPYLPECYICIYCGGESLWSCLLVWEIVCAWERERERERERESILMLSIQEVFDRKKHCRRTSTFQFCKYNVHTTTYPPLHLPQGTTATSERVNAASSSYSLARPSI